jgi:hypothetical protein
MLHRGLEQGSPQPLTSALRYDVELLEISVERARVEGRPKAKLGDPSGPSPANSTVTSPFSISGAARSAITVASGVDSSNSTLNACRSRPKTGASATFASRIGAISCLLVSSAVILVYGELVDQIVRYSVAPRR